MGRLFLRIAFQGTGFAGWQLQKDHRTVQGVLQDAIHLLLGGRDRPLPIGSSRTDAGVHAEDMGVHVDVPDDRTTERWRLGLNAKLPWEVRVIHAAWVDADFHARRSCCRKTYLYRFWTQGEPPPRWWPYVWRHSRVSDWPAARRAAALFTGEHDFSSFLVPEPGQRAVRSLEPITFHDAGDHMEMRVTARAFARKMVRFLAGAVAEAGRGAITPGELAQVLEARDNRLAPAIAPAEGLTLEQVDYGGAAALRPGAPSPDHSET